MQFTDEEIAALAAYVASVAPGPAIPSEDDYDYADADVAEGGEIYRTNCAMCHNYAGSGGALTQGKYAPSLKGTEPKHMYEAMLTGPQSMPVFGDDTMTPESKRDIIAFLKTTERGAQPRRPEPGQDRAGVRGCRRLGVRHRRADRLRGLAGSEGQMSHPTRSLAALAIPRGPR